MSAPPQAPRSRAVQRRDLPGRRSQATAELVLEIATAAAGERELGPILSSTLDRLRGFVSLTGGSIALVEDDDLVVRAAVGPFADHALGQRLRRGPSRSWQVVRTRQSFLSGDLQADGLQINTPGAERTIRSWLAVPIVRQGEGIGLLEVDSTRRNAFTDRDLQLVETIVKALAGPVDLAWRYAAERRATQLRDAFVGVISHELRTPITTIYGTSKLLRRHGSTMSAEAREQAIEDIEAEADRLRRLVEDLLVLSRAESGRVEVAPDPVLLGHVVRRVVESEAPRWPGHAFSIDIPAGLPIVGAEETYLEQVLRNFLTNAAKYSPAGSRIRVVVEATATEVRVRVLDEGIGLGDGDPTRLFQLFYRSPSASRHASGAGIGLFVCRQLVEAMGGRVWAAPGDERGAEFGFALPVDEATLGE